MPLKVFLSSSLRKYVSQYNPVKGIEIELEDKSTVAEICRNIDVPVEQIKVIMVNGRNAEFDSVLKGDERIGLFPSIGGG